MGQKVNPHGLRVGVIKDWDSKWYAEADFADCLVEDYNIRKFLKKRLFSAGISKIEIERASDRVKVIIYTDGSARSNPGRGGYGAVLKYTNPAGKTFTSELSRGYAKTTNNRMELMAVIEIGRAHV